MTRSFFRLIAASWHFRGKTGSLTCWWDAKVLIACFHYFIIFAISREAWLLGIETLSGSHAVRAWEKETCWGHKSPSSFILNVECTEAWFPIHRQAISMKKRRIHHMLWARAESQNPSELIWSVPTSCHTGVDAGTELMIESGLACFRPIAVRGGECRALVMWLRWMPSGAVELQLLLSPLVKDSVFESPAETTLYYLALGNFRWEIKEEKSGSLLLKRLFKKTGRSTSNF